MHHRIRSVATVLAAALLAVPRAASGQVVHYAYDAAGRLSAVADPHGDVAVYEYDAVGNLLSIRRIGVADLPDAVVIAYVSPKVAARGASVSIFGKGFGATVDANAVTFNGAPAAVLTASPTRLTVRVPENATTGPIHLTTPMGAATSNAFRLLGALNVTPPTAVVAPRGRIQFAASGEGLTGVRWSVDRVPGGDAQRGTIAADGLYVAPDSLPLAGVRVTATSVADSALEATAQVTMIASRPLFVAADPFVVGFPPPSPRVDLTTIASVGVAPVILSLMPSAAAPGEAIRLVVTGVGFEGATRLELAALGPAAALIVSDVTVSADGMEAAADLVLPLDTPLGLRLVRIVTPAGSSGDAVPGQNVFSVR